MVIWGAADAVTITDGAEVAAITTDGAITGFTDEYAVRTSRSGRGNGHGAAASEAGGSVSIQFQFDGDANQVRMILRPELLLQQRRCVGDCLVGNIQRIGDLDDPIAAA